MYQHIFSGARLQATFNTLVRSSLIPGPSPGGRRLRRREIGSQSSLLRCMSVAIALFLASSVFGQSVSTYDPESRITTHRLAITPAAEMKPRFRYRFSVPLHEQVAGNAAMHYVRSFAEGGIGGIWRDLEQQFGREVHEWYGQSPISDLPLEKAKAAATAFDGYVGNFIVRATRCRDCDWGLAEESLPGQEMYVMLIPEVQETRNIARVLMLRARVAIAEHRYDDALEHLKMCYQLGINVSRLKFIVADLVALAEVGMANNVLIELIGSPDSPNMYWALAELPEPIVDLRESLQLEYSFFNRLIPSLATVETDNKTQEQWQAELFDAVDRMLNLGSIVSGQHQVQPEIKAFTFAMTLATYSGAKRRLVESGLNAEAVEKLPVGQALLWDFKNQILELSHEAESISYLRFPDAKQRTETFDENLGRNENLTLAHKFAAMLFPATQQVQAAQVRIERQRAAMMIVEAIRMHVAQVGSLPASLDEISIVPIPNNPVTQQPFQYSVEGDAAILELPRSDGLAVGERFEITLAKPESR